MSEYGWALVLAGCLLLVFAVSNYIHDRGAPFYISRKVSHLASAPLMVALPLLFESIVYPLALSAAFFGLLLITHRYNVFHGFAKKGRLSELWFPFSVFLSIAVLWPIDPWAAIVPPLFLAIGDGFTGITRMVLYKREVKGWGGTGACAFVCIPIGAVLISPFWLGILAAVGATFAERYCGDAEGSLVPLDDNLSMPLFAVVIIAGGLHALRLMS